MRIVVDTNIAFSAMLNTDSRIAQILLQPRNNLTFYSTQQLLLELEEHRDKIQKISRYTDDEFLRIKALVTNRIRFINIRLVSKRSFALAETLTSDIDIDDTEFVALTEHMKGKLWSGDKALEIGLKRKGWNRIISTNELIEKSIGRKK